MAPNLQRMIKTRMVEGSAIEGEIAADISTPVHFTSMMPASTLAAQSQGASSVVALVRGILQSLV
jgi:hypothetical protein